MFHNVVRPGFAGELVVLVAECSKKTSCHVPFRNQNFPQSIRLLTTVPLPTAITHFLRITHGQNKQKIPATNKQGAKIPISITARKLKPSTRSTLVDRQLAIRNRQRKDRHSGRISTAPGTIISLVTQRILIHLCSPTVPIITT